MRGLIISPSVRIPSPGEVLLSGGINSQLLRMWLLYWDQLVWPETSGALRIGIQDEFDFLEKLGIFRRVQVQGGADDEISALLIHARNETFTSLEGTNPGSWAVASGPGTWEGPESNGDRGLQVKLVGALPVPDKDVPLNDILEFRERRADERDALMHFIDATYQSVLAAPDTPLAEQSALENLARSAREQLNVMTEARLPFRLLDIAADFNLLAGAVAGIGSVALGATWPWIIGNSLLAGASVTIGHVLGMSNPKQTPTPYRYVAAYHEEVFNRD